MGLVDSLKRPRRRVELVLDGAAYVEYEAALAEQVAVAEEFEVTSKNDGRLVNPLKKRLDDAAARVAEARAAQEASTVVFVLEAIPRDKWDALVTKFPPRDGNKDDESIGFNDDTFMPALLGSTDPIVTVGVERLNGEVQDFDPAEWAELWPALTPGQASEFRSAVFGLHVGENKVPFTRTASAAKRVSAAK